MLTRKDVQDTHLTTILKERGPLTAEALWSASQLDIDDFYDQLKDEEARGLLGEARRFFKRTTHAGGRMRLDRLSIPNYRNLRSFEIDFDESQPTTVLIGRNGSGKSNLIEAIVEIFCELELSGTPSFAYTLQYVPRAHHPDRRRSCTAEQAPRHHGRRQLVTQRPFSATSTPTCPTTSSPTTRDGAVGWSGTSTARPAGTTTVS